MKKVSLIWPLLIISLLAIGVSYGAWANYLGINIFARSGSFNVVFDQNRNCSVQVMKISGARGESAGGGYNIDCRLDDTKKQARISFDDPLLLEELLGEDVFLCLSFPLAIDERSSVRSIMPLRADLSVPAQEQVKFEPADARLSVDGYELVTATTPVGAGDPLHWDVYRQVELVGEQLVGTVFLKLVQVSPEAFSDTPAAVIDVSQLPEAATAYIQPIDDGTSGLIQADLSVEYRFSVPLFVEQGRR